MSIIPSDMALSPMGGGARKWPLRWDKAYPSPVPALEPVLSLFSSLRGANGRANARPMTGSATKHPPYRSHNLASGLLRFARNDALPISAAV